MLQVPLELVVVHLTKIVGDRSARNTDASPATMLLELDNISVVDIGREIIAGQLSPRDPLFMAVIDELEQIPTVLVALEQIAKRIGSQAQLHTTGHETRDRFNTERSAAEKIAWSNNTQCRKHRDGS